MLRRRLGHLVLITCALMAIATLAFALRAMFVQDSLMVLGPKARMFVLNYPAHVHVLFVKTAGSWYWSWRRSEPIPLTRGYFEPHVRHEPGGATLFWIPHWLLFLLTAPWPLWWLARHRKQATRRRRGLCTQCGYDLRASPDRCPECGAEIRGMGNLPMHSAAKQQA